MKSAQALIGSKAALLVAQPGHELRLHGWMELARPLVCVGTCGEDPASTGRLAATTRLLEQVGARVGGVMGPLSHSELYDAVLHGRIRVFHDLVERLAADLVAHRIELVVADAAEGAVLVNDVWRGVVNAAVELASLQLGRAIVNFEFAVVGSPDRCPEECRAESLRIGLYDESFDRKLRAAQAYEPLRAEVDESFSHFGEEAFRTEWLWPTAETNAAATRIPDWELRGERLVAAGKFTHVVRYQRHVAPLLAQLQPELRRAA